MRDHLILNGCTDCLMLIANGDTSGNERCQTEEGEAAYLADVDRETEGLRIWPGEWEAPYVSADYDEPAFSDLIADVFRGELEPGDLDFDLWGASHSVWTETDRYYGTDHDGRFGYGPCDVCGSPLGGDFYPVGAER